ncbi:hypothetical protein D3C84_755530 [compost metagenome]
MADVEKHRQAVPGQALQTGIGTFETNVPDAAQTVRQTLGGHIGHIERRFTGGDRGVGSGQFAMPIEHRRHSGTGQRQAGHEPSSGNRHCATCVSHEAGFIQARTSVGRGNLWGVRVDAYSCRSELARDEPESAVGCQAARVIVDDPREHARSYRGDAV